MLLASSGSLEAPGAVEVIDRSYDFESHGTSFGSLMVLVEDSKEASHVIKCIGLFPKYEIWT